MLGVHKPFELESQQQTVENSMVVEEEEEDTGVPPPKKPKEAGKWKGYDSKRVFKKEWEKEFAWLSGIPDDPTSAYCKVCTKKIRAHKGDIEKHQKTKKHLKKQTTSEILADLIPISCENLDGTKNSDIDHQGDARVVQTAGQEALENGVPGNILNGVGDGQQIIYFTESAVDASHQNTNAVIDKLVEKYHQKRIENLKVEHEATLELQKEQLVILKQQLEAEAQVNTNKNLLQKEEHEVKLKFLQEEHEAKLRAIEDERDARLKAIEQELMYAKQEYEKKMRLLDVQLSSTMKHSGPTKESFPNHEQYVCYETNADQNLVYKMGNSI